MTRQLFLVIITLGLFVVAYIKSLSDSDYDERFATTGIWVFGVFTGLAAVFDIAMTLPSWGGE
jgi:phage shock protein PspC (stress-responsive transcriptional regulator)